MKNATRITILITICCYLISNSAFAQPPQAIPYQAVARNNSGNLITGQNISLRFTIHNLTSGGSILYQETQSTSTNTLGLMSVNMGSGNRNLTYGTFTAIPWATGNKFLQVELDAAGGTTYTDMGTTQMMSVPYALYAGSAALPSGTHVGDVMSWNGTQWVIGCPSGQVACSGTCVNLLTDANNCSACGVVCAFANAAAGCANGSCYIISCNSGFVNCDNVSSNGCEINITNNINNCGSCSVVCSSSNIATPLCTSGVCTGSCNSGFADCNGNKQTDGCEINITSNVNNCGSCGAICSSNNIATPLCTSGVCTGTCNSGFADCNGNKRTDGCEINISANVSNCGSCGAVCSSSNIATPVCTSGVCTGTCNSGFADCNGNKLTDGCELNIATNLNNCGSCGAVCSSSNIATPLCTSGVCTGTCNTGFADCNANKQTDGCEINLSNNPNNCGSCGAVCSSSNIASPTCTSGVCTGNCNSGFADCNGNKLTDGCEVNVNTSPNNCGLCGKVCSSNNISVPICTSGLCTGSCNTGFADCNGNKQTDGCETNIFTNPSNCGGCGAVCSTNHIVTPTCSGGTCTGSCASGFADCNSNKLADGCEININNDASHCGTCTNVCASGHLCVGGICN